MSVATISQTKSTTKGTAEKILTHIMGYRRIAKKNRGCANAMCQACTAQHLPNIVSAIEKNHPIHFVLPAFPGKSPNTNKVLGHLPDLAEKLALRFLGKLCEEIKRYYLPGIKIIICSDGRVFNDVIGITESAVSDYQAALKSSIIEMGLTDISTFNLEDHYHKQEFGQMRSELLEQYAPSLTSIKTRIKLGAQPRATQEDSEMNQLYRGITRFLFEDALHPEQTASRSHIQKEARKRAYELIHRSNAWSALIAEHFPHAVRLSIHPHGCGSKKLGIKLIQSESWMTPWHGVAVEASDGYALLKRYEAEALDAKLIYSSNGAPSHYKIMQDLNFINRRNEHGLHRHTH